jgi:hypothetical protein
MAQQSVRVVIAIGWTDCESKRAGPALAPCLFQRLFAAEAEADGPPARERALVSSFSFIVQLPLCRKPELFISAWRFARLFP